MFRVRYGLRLQKQLKKEHVIHHSTPDGSTLIQEIKIKNKSAIKGHCGVACEYYDSPSPDRHVANYRNTAITVLPLQANAEHITLKF